MENEIMCMYLAFDSLRTTVANMLYSFDASYTQMSNTIKPLQFQQAPVARFNPNPY